LIDHFDRNKRNSVEVENLLSALKRIFPSDFEVFERFVLKFMDGMFFALILKLNFIDCDIRN